MRPFLSCIVAWALLHCGPILALGQDQGSTITTDLQFQQYFLPGQDDLSTAVASIDVDSTLFEWRFNYEARDSGSFWIGHNFDFGDSWELALNPMAGLVAGDLEGAAPGLKAELSWNRINVYSEMEYVFSFDSSEDNFFYAWSEMTYAITDWLSAGIVGNRTRAYDSPVELDRGPTVAMNFGKFTVSCTALNLDEDVLMIVSLGASFGDT